MHIQLTRAQSLYRKIENFVQVYKMIHFLLSRLTNSVFV